MNEIPIIKITAKNGAIYKLGQRFALDVTYELKDGRTFEGCIDRDKKKNVLPGLERANQSAAAGAFFASFHNGEFFGTVQKWSIGGAGLVPQAQPEVV